jgi:hypothetical protein
MTSSIAALLALIPMMTGPLPEAERTITAAMCGGGTITIPLGNRDDQPKPDCAQKACHAGSCREKTKRGKLI